VRDQTLARLAALFSFYLMSNYFGENKAQEGHGRQSLHGGAFSLAARGINAVVQVGSVLFLARLLSPEDYGLVAMVLAVTGFAPVLVDLGSRDAVVQRERLTPGEVSGLFWVTMGVACVFALLVAASGSLIARIYNEPRLTSIALVSSLAFVASALISQHHSLLRRAMKFRQIAVIEVGSNVLGAACAIAMAFYGLGYWALVVRPIATLFFTAIGVWVQSRWLPGAPTFTSGVKEMLKFGLNLTGFCMTDFASRSSDRIAIGIKSGARPLGYYQQAFMVYDNLLDLTAALHSVAVVSLSKLRENLVELKRLWAKGLSTLAFYTMPIFGVLAVVSQDLVVVVLGEKWATAGVLLSVLALRGIPHSVERTLGWLHVAAGRADRWMHWGFFAAAAQLVALFCGLPFGPMGIIVAYVLLTYVLFVPAIAFGGKPLGIGHGDVLEAVSRPLTGALAAVGVGFLLRFTVCAELHALPRMILLGFAYLGTYLLIMVGIFRIRTPLDIVFSLLRNMLPGRFAPIAR